MAAVLACGSGAVLSHHSAAELWDLLPLRAHPVEISVPAGIHRHPGVAVHRRTAPVLANVTKRHGIPVTNVALTLTDIAARISRGRLEAAINEADTCDLTDPEHLRALVEALPRIPGRGVMRRTLDRRTFRLTRSQLERRFRPIARRAGLPAPETRVRLNGYEVDFFWPDLGLVVETDGLRYHRTPASQARDRERDQAHTAAGLTPLRFTHEQVAFEPARVEATLSRVATRLRGVGPRSRSDP
jgi:very-short-patch-repair endonuclease